MQYLQAEFKRLCKYTEGLGIKMTFIEKPRYPANAEWAVDGSEIIIYNRSKKGPLQLCLDLIHEISHHLHWSHNGRKGNLKTDKILAKQEAGKELTKKQRKHIYEMEKIESQYQTIIHKEIGSKIPLSRLLVEIDYDIWIYKYWYINGVWPKRPEMRAEFKSLRVKHGLK